ncbi:MAG: DNA primase [Clostridia bacterium]|nr:DNA primase [Clostridia bacterium]
MAVSADFQDFVDEVLERNDITEVISEYAKLKRVGSRYAALCPLHNDKKSPSLSISPDKQLFHCFGCGAGGNVIHFIMAMEHLDFMDALKYLADRARIPMPEQGSSTDRKRREETMDKKQKIYQINAEAARYFYRHLAGDEGKDAYAYLKERGITNATIKMFGLGYAPAGWTRLLDYLKEKGYSEHDVFEAGLAKARDNGSFYDAFYDGRVMFPIINVQGNIIGFGGRIMQENSNTGKYLNTPETLVFKKKENLFGLNLAKNSKAGRMLLMEGYMDVISLHQAGINNAIASLGTAFTPEQARLLKKYTSKAVLCYDADDAGKKAALRAGDILTEQGFKTKVLTITDGKDPDEFIKTKGPEMFQVLVEGARPLIGYKIDAIKQHYDLNDTEQMLEFTEAAAGVLSEINNEIELELYTKQIAKEAGISPDTLSTQVKVLRRKQQQVKERQEERKERKNFEERTGGRRDLHEMGLKNAERLLLNFMAEEPAVMKKVKESGLTAEDFTEGIHRKLAEKLLACPDDRVDGNALLEQFSPEEIGVVAAILLDDKNTENKKEASIQPLAKVLDAKQRIKQAELLTNDDLHELDKMLKQKEQEKRRNQTWKTKNNPQ